MIRSKPIEKPQAGTSLPEEPADHAVVAAASRDRGGLVLVADLEDLSGVVRHPSHQGRIERRARSARPTAAATARITARRATRRRAVAVDGQRSQHVVDLARRAAPARRARSSGPPRPPGGMVGRLQLGPDPGGADLVELVEADEDALEALGGESAVLGEGDEQAPVVDPDGQIGRGRARAGPRRWPGSAPPRPPRTGRPGCRCRTG